MKKITKNIYLNKIIKFMKNDYPLIKNMDLYGFYDQLSEEEINYVLSGIFEKPITKKGNSIYNDNGYEIYHEYSNGDWEKFEYDKNGNMVYYNYSDGFWKKYEYDENGNKIYKENSKGYWIKWEYDDNVNKIYSEDSSREYYDCTLLALTYCSGW